MTKVTYEINPDLKKQLKNIPSSCGIYMMLDKKRDVLYIGKALNLKTRIRSYLKTASWKDRPKLYFMMPKVEEIKTVLTRSEKEALILEANLVNKYQPKYNVTLKDDKKFPWLMITYDEEYPRLVPIRNVKAFRKKFPGTKNKFFGPYSDAGAMWETYKILKEGFQLRLRKSPLFKDRTCINYHIGLCSGPCQKLISHDNYKKIVNQVEDFLLGKYDAVLDDLKKQMKEASSLLYYEKATKLRNTIQKIEKVLEKQIVVSDDHKVNQDIFACGYEDQTMVLELLLIRQGKVIAIESITIALPKGTKVEEAFNDAIKQYYIRTQDENIPSEIIVQFDLADKENIKEWLSSRLKEKVTIVHPKRGKNLELIKMAQLNAKLALQRIAMSNIGNVVGAYRDKPLQDLKNELSLKTVPKHIECFDISHLSGTGTVGSMICFIDGRPEKSMYRKFKIKSLSLNKIDDFAAMREIIVRQYRRDAPIGRLYTDKLPNLIVIDGGKGQLSAAKEALENVGIDLNEIDLISIAKKKEEIFKVGTRSPRPYNLDKNSPALHLIQRIRDEAHRFAITFQRDTRSKNVFQSESQKGIKRNHN